MMAKQQEPNPAAPCSSIGRRDFLSLSRNLAVGGVLAHVLWVDQAVAAIPASTGYLLVDTKKCQGCVSCMLACSLVHEGVASLSTARIQVLQNCFGKWPHDIDIEQCFQCTDPTCVAACPEDALIVDKNHGNVRLVDRQKCTGCGACLESCKFAPSRTMSVPDADKEAGFHATKCDLCANAPYHWISNGGGPNGQQACVEVCPVGAIKFTTQTPRQKREAYNVNLREEAWAELGFPID
jgi:protein NrfC